MRNDGPAYSLQILSVPPDHHPGQIERPAFGSADPAHHFTVASPQELSREDFRNQLATNISGRIGSNRDVLLYVHGFNTGLDAARFPSCPDRHGRALRRHSGALHLAGERQSPRL